MSEYDTEPVPGLPEELPDGERLLWQGAPEWRAIARRVFYMRAIALYFALLVFWRLLTLSRDGESLFNVVGKLPLALMGLGLLALLAWLVSKTTIYTITNRRVVMRFGLALPMTVNLPFAVIEAAALRMYADGTGDIPLTLQGGGKRLGYLAWWPHARPWQVSEPQPMLRGVAQAAAVAEILAQALAGNTVDAARRTAATTPAADEPSRASVTA